jgi:hypothetical protein
MVMAMDVLSVVHLFIMPQRKGFALIIQRSWKNKTQNFISRYNLRTGIRQRMVVESPKCGGMCDWRTCSGQPGGLASRLAMPPNYFYNRYS